MFYTLMRKNDIVAPVNVDEFGYITRFRAQPNADLFPSGIMEMPGMTISNIRAWWCQRAVPADRDGIQSYGVSPTDCYWLKPDGSDLTWEKVNLYDQK